MCFAKGVRLVGRETKYDWLRALETIAEFDQLNGIHQREGLVQLGLRDSVMLDHEFRVGHVLRIIAPHHLGQNEVESRGPEKFQVPQGQPRDRNDLLKPALAQKTPDAGNRCVM